MTHVFVIDDTFSFTRDAFVATRLTRADAVEVGKAA
jgi:hypothetical protein